MKSMTGFGRAAVEQEGHSCSVEIRTVNHRHCEISLKLPRQLQQLEPALRRQLAERFLRGSITVTVTLDGQEEDLGVPALNRPVAKRYLDVLREFRQRHGLSGMIDVNTVAGLPEFFTWEKSLAPPRKLAAVVHQAVDGAVDEVDRERQREGRALKRECKKRVTRVRSLLRTVERRAPQRAQEVKKRYEARIEALAPNAQLDPHRLAQELATLADRLDFTEETVRLSTHTDQLLELMESGEPIGRRLTFLLQEMSREANTIGSKASDPKISMDVVEIKEELEKLREQAQNVE